MPAPYPDEFKQRAMQMVRDGTPIIQVARQLGIAESGLRRWLDQDGRGPGSGGNESAVVILSGVAGGQATSSLWALSTSFGCSSCLVS